MPRKITFGEMPTTAPEGNFRRVRFPQLARLDQGTNEGMVSRILSSEGANSRELPRTISMQYVDDQGHLRSVPAGSLWSLTVDGESGLLSGEGWLVDTPDGHLAERVIAGKALQHNSIDLSDIPHDGMRIVEHGDWWDDDFHVDVIFEKWSVGKTTLVASPAFANARVELADDIEASLGSDEPLVCDAPGIFGGNSSVEIVAGMSTRPSWDHFNRPESDIPHPIVVDEPDAAGWIPVYGHLAQWRKQHRNALGQLVHPPRGYDGYSNYAKPKAVLTDGGWAKAGPITLLGGHVSLRDAANKVENVWADVHVVDGKHGPWVCGVMRPHIAADEIETYRARASQISGYWAGGVLRLICSVVGAGYPITEREDEDALVAAFEPEVTAAVIPSALLSFTELQGDALQSFVDMVKSGAFRDNHTVIALNDNGTIEPSTFDAEAARRLRERELALESEAGLC